MIAVCYCYQKLGLAKRVAVVEILGPEGWQAEGLFAVLSF